MMAFPADKKVVIIGAGYAGKSLASELIKLNANVTIIDTKDSFHHNVAGVRTVVDESYARKMFIPYKPAFGEHFRQGTITKIDPKAQVVTLEDGGTVPYDALIIATGSVGPFKEAAKKREDSIGLYSKFANAVKTSKSIVFIGGGPVGVEAAAEVASEYPDKSVTIIHAGDTLISSSAPEEFTKILKEKVKNFKIYVIYGELVQNLDKIRSGIPGNYEVVTDKGRVVKADLVFKTTGLSINKAAYASSLGAAVEPNGALKVNQFLQVDGYKNIFAIGDCNNQKLAKVAFVAGEEGKYISENLGAFLSGQPMQPWDNARIQFYMGLSLGRNQAVAALANGVVMPEETMVAMKSQDMMLGRFYGELNQTLAD